MKKQPFSWIAVGIGGLIALVVLKFGPLSDQTDAALPLLTALLLCEFGALVTAAGAYVGFRAWLPHRSDALGLLLAVLCLGLALGFLWLGLEIWSGLST